MECRWKPLCGLLKCLTNSQPKPACETIQAASLYDELRVRYPRKSEMLLRVLLIPYARLQCHSCLFLLTPSTAPCSASRGVFQLPVEGGVQNLFLLARLSSGAAIKGQTAANKQYYKNRCALPRAIARSLTSILILSAWLTFIHLSLAICLTLTPVTSLQQRRVPQAEPQRRPMHLVIRKP